MGKDIETRIAEGVTGVVVELLESIKNIQIPNEYANNPLPYLKGYIDGLKLSIDRRLDAALKAYTSEVPQHSRQQIRGTGHERGFQIKYLEGSSAVEVRGQKVILTANEDVLMQHLWNNSNRVCNYSELENISAVRTPERVIRSLRRKIEEDYRKPQFIVTVPKSGYKLNTNP